MREIPEVNLTKGQRAAFDELKASTGTQARDSVHAGVLRALDRKGVASRDIVGRRNNYYRVDDVELQRMGFAALVTGEAHG